MVFVVRLEPWTLEASAEAHDQSRILFRNAEAFPLLKQGAPSSQAAP
jgi:hypothetical protein